MNEKEIEDQWEYDQKIATHWKERINNLKHELISEFLEDLKLNHPMIGFKYTRIELIEKWEKIA